MSETLDNTIASLDDLSTKTIKSGIEFQGFTKSLTQAAAGTEKQVNNGLFLVV